MAQQPQPSPTGTDLRLLQRIAQLEQRLEDLQPNAPKPSDVEERHHKTFEEQARESRERDAAFQSRLDGAIQTETRDDAWASELEASLRTKLSDAVFAGVQLEDVECRRSLCRLRVQHKYAENRDQFPHMFMSKGPTRTEIDATWAREDFENSATTIYLSRAGTMAFRELEHVDEAGP